MQGFGKNDWLTRVANVDPFVPMELGDDIHDAPAIHAADISLHVDGSTGLAHEATHMILLKPDNGVLAGVGIESRRTYAIIMKYIRMGTSSDFGNILAMALASLVMSFLPLTAGQLIGEAPP